jgi:hypothetical protein
MASILLPTASAQCFDFGVRAAFSAAEQPLG